MQENGAIQSANPLPVDDLVQGSGTGQEELLFNLDVADSLPDWAAPWWDVLETWPIVLLPVLVLLAYLVGKAVQAFLTKGVKRLTSRTASTFDDDLVSTINRPVVPTMVTLALLIGVSTLGMPDLAHNVTVRLLYLVLLILWTVAALRAAHILLELLSSHSDRFTAIQPRTIPAFDIALKFVVVGAAAYMFLIIWGIDPTAWLASAGVIGIAVGFAARDTLANLFSGIFIIADAPYKIGDYIVLDTGERGIVKQVGMRSTRLLTRDDVEITIPNAVIGNAKIVNESGGPWEKQRIRLPIGVAYGSDVDAVDELLVKTALDHPEVVREPAPRARFRVFGASSLDFELLCWVAHPELRGRITHELNKSIYKALAQAGIQIPFPQQDVYIRSMPGKDGE